MKQYDFHVWAYEKTFSHLRKLPGDLFEKEVQSVFRSLSEVFAHVYVVDHLWLGSDLRKKLC
ncbi:DinB family protein [Halobacillus shinanisalinarum]|uniref:DinB family protein n=1 Tax=Halobacillus shinanisalinarum TaxID=2932258 RepID=UPI0021060C4A|nr:DinB family protein [Halobacillus shinanisalinarum]